jgi:hypothetical protein
MRYLNGVIFIGCRCHVPEAAAPRIQQLAPPSSGATPIDLTAPAQVRVTEKIPRKINDLHERT